MSYPKRTQRPAIKRGGIVFESYQVGIGKYVLYVGGPDEPRGWIQSNYSGLTYSAAANGVVLGRRFRGEDTAIRAVVDALAQAAP